MAGFSQMKNLSRIIIPTELQAEATSPPTPHFDDETTLLTARAVVPIEEAAASGNLRSYLVKAAIVLTAALLGAAVAVSVDFFQNRRPREATAVVEPSAPATQSPVAETSDSSPPGPQANDSAVSAPTTKVSATADQGALGATPDIHTEEKRPPNDNATGKEKSGDSEGAANRRNVVVKRSERLTQRRQAAKVQRSGAADRIIERPSDAGRIREIFEGPNPF